MAASRRNGSSTRRAIRKPVYASTANSASTTTQPTTPSSSATTAKMKSLSASGSQSHFSALLPSPTPNQPPS